MNTAVALERWSKQPHWDLYLMWSWSDPKQTLEQFVCGEQRIQHRPWHILYLELSHSLLTESKIDTTVKQEWDPLSCKTGAEPRRPHKDKDAVTCVGPQRSSWTPHLVASFLSLRQRKCGECRWFPFKVRMYLSRNESSDSSQPYPVVTSMIKSNAGQQPEFFWLDPDRKRLIEKNVTTQPHTA